MLDRTGATMLEDLPEVMLQQILVLLPSKDVGRCRVVSPSWRNATSTTEFMLEHHNRQPLLPIINGERKRAGYVVFGDAGAGTSKQECRPLMLQENIFGCTVQGSCDGFFIIYDPTRGDQFSICNPVTCEASLLPKPPMQYNSVIGFYFHHPAGEYRVLWRSHSPYEPCLLYVLTVGYDKPRHLIPRMPTVLSPSMQQKLLSRVLCGQLPPVFLHGSLHWCPFGGANDITGGGGDIIVFNTETESFRWMHSPAKPTPDSKLFDMKGAFAFWSCSDLIKFTSMDVWVMQDYEAEIWSFKYRIDLSKVEVSRQLYLSSAKKKKKTPHDSEVQFFNDMAVINERELLIMFNWKYVLHCDTDGNVLGLVKLGKNQYCMSLTQHRLQESILPVPSHEMQG